ncbi:hypothetical protein [Saccharothrix syringae]|nr:hypothetical protein [Saccharothrix syringae]
MVLDNGWPRRGRRYYAVLLPLVLAVSVGTLVLDGPRWLAIGTGSLFGGLVVDAVVDWLEFRRGRGEGGRDRPS